SPSAPPASGEAKTVLVVDDEARFTETLAAGLEANGYRTLQAPNAAAGWDLAHAHLPALILCDIDMPGKDGLRLLQDIRDDAALADTPFVLMTGKPKYGNQRAAMDLLADDFLLKPFSLAALLSCVDARLRRAALSRRRSGGAAAPPSPPEKVAPAPPAPAPAGPAAAVPVPAGESPDSRAVLVIDDEAYFRKFVGRVLRNAGVTNLIEACDGVEALQLSQEHQPRLVLLDINMPHMDGLATLVALRKLSRAVPIVMLTSISEEAIVEECVNQGASYFIRKDVPAGQLTEALHAALDEFVEHRPPPP
ncbi:MAG TPA: response regulator, partial [Opitutaceae bacterium]|nr:response regulator [Opitutaceae bacterium]